MLHELFEENEVGGVSRCTFDPGPLKDFWDKSEIVYLRMPRSARCEQVKTLHYRVRNEFAKVPGHRKAH
jgi:hypothetical protein